MEEIMSNGAAGQIFGMGAVTKSLVAFAIIITLIIAWNLKKKR